MPNTALQYITKHPNPTADDFIKGVAMFGGKAINDAIAIRKMMDERVAASRKAGEIAKKIDPAFTASGVCHNMSIPTMGSVRMLNPIWEEVIEQVRIYRRLDGKIYRAKKKAGFIQGEGPSK